MSKEQTSENRDGNAQPPGLSIRLIARIAGSLGRYKWMVALGSILVCFVAWSDMKIIQIITDIINTGVPESGSIGIMLLPLIIISVLNRGCGWVQWILSSYAANKAMAGLRKQFFEKLHTLSKQFFDQHKAGWLTARSTGDLAIIQDFMNFALMMSGFLVTLVGSALVRIAGISPVLLVPPLVMMPVMIYATFRYKKRMTSIQRLSRDQNSRLIANMSESVRGVRVVQAFSRQRRNLDDFNTLNMMSHDTEISAAKLDALFLPALDFIGVLNTTLVVVFASWLIRHPDVLGLTHPLTTGDITAYILYMYMILWPTRMVVEIYSMSIRTMAAAERIYEIVDMPPTVTDPQEPVPVDGFTGKVEFCDVGFRYDRDGNWIIRNFDLKIDPGETVALVGSTGAGKTTVANLVSRFYDTEEGVVKIDGRDIRQYRQSDMHAAMGIVLQQGYLFSGTVMENLCFRSPDMKPDDVIAYAKDLGAHDVIMALADGYDTEIMEGGESLSLGQRQIISITRAMLADPDILILDEPTSSLDIHTESAIQSAIDHLVKDRTTLIIAHRLSTVKHADRIIVIEDGKIVESGNHAELISLNGRYSEMVKLSSHGMQVLGC
jgi:ABC-type multidrug transport system fused ATPase/permease subunit